MQSTVHNAGMASRFHLSVQREVRIPTKDCAAKQSPETIYLIDNDWQSREGISELLTSLDVKVVSFGSADEYFERGKPGEPGCLIIDMQLPGNGGIDLQHRIGREIGPPVIFISSVPDVPAMVRVMKAGAISILTKPINAAALVEAVHEAFAHNLKKRLRRAELAKLQGRYSLLTPREREVVPLVIGGLLNKQAASILGISEVTLQIHRSQVMRKMEAASCADLVRMALQLRIPHWRVESQIPEFSTRAFANSRGSHSL